MSSLKSVVDIDASASSGEAAQNLAVPHITTRSEMVSDADWIANLHARSFGPGRFARAAFRVREQLAEDPSLGLIAECNGERVGSVCMTPISVSGINGYLLGPLATDPEFRNRGAGKLLVKSVTELALSRREGKFVLLIGDHSYYGALGYEATEPGAIRFPGPVDPHRVLVHVGDFDNGASLAGHIMPFKTL